MNTPTVAPQQPPVPEQHGHDGLDSTCLDCAAESLASTGCPGCIRLMAYLHLARMFIKNAQMLGVRDGSRWAITIQLVIGCASLALLLVCPPRVVLAAVALVQVGHGVLTHVMAAARFKAMHRQLCEIVRVDPAAEKMDPSLLARAARTAVLVPVRPPMQ